MIKGNQSNQLDNFYLNWLLHNIDGVKINQDLVTTLTPCAGQHANIFWDNNARYWYICEGNIEKLFSINYLSLIQMSSSSISLLQCVEDSQKRKKGIMTVINGWRTVIWKYINIGKGNYSFFKHEFILIQFKRCICEWLTERCHLRFNKSLCFQIVYWNSYICYANDIRVSMRISNEILGEIFWSLLNYEFFCFFQVSHDVIKLRVMWVKIVSGIQFNFIMLETCPHTKTEYNIFFTLFLITSQIYFIEEKCNPTLNNFFV